MLTASLTHSLTHVVGDHGLYAVFALMLVDSVFPAGSELVMVYAGALAAGTVGGQHIVVFGDRLSSHLAGYVAGSPSQARSATSSAPGSAGLSAPGRPALH